MRNLFPVKTVKAFAVAPTIIVFFALATLHILSNAPSGNWVLGYGIFLGPVVIFSFIATEKPVLMAKFALALAWIYALGTLLLILFDNLMYLGPAFAFSALFFALALLAAWGILRGVSAFYRS